MLKYILSLLLLFVFLVNANASNIEDKSNTKTPGDDTKIDINKDPKQEKNLKIYFLMYLIPLHG